MKVKQWGLLDIWLQISFKHYENRANLTFKNRLSLSWGKKKKTHWPWPLCSQIQASQRCSKLSACQAKSHSLSLVGIRFSAFCIKMMMLMGSSNEQSTHTRLNSTGRMLWSAVWAENVVHHQAQKIIQSEKIRRPAPHWQIYFSI